MSHKLLISHASLDRELASQLRTLIHRCSLGQIDAWFSSDPTGDGGMRAGTRWFEEIRQHLLTSKAIIALVTPASITRPWLYFEAGFGAAVAEVEVIPVAIGLGRIAEIPLPLAAYESFELKDKATANLFLTKILGRFGVQYDAEMAAPVVASVLPRLAGLISSDHTTQELRAQPAGIDVNNLINYLDHRFIELQRALQERGPLVTEYSIMVHLPGKEIGKSHKSHVTIQSNASVQDVFDDIYFLIADRVGSHKYLEEWVLMEPATDTYLVVKEVQARIPATALFQPGAVWSVRLLDKPYSANESSERTERSLTSALAASRGSEAPDPPRSRNRTY